MNKSWFYLGVISSLSIIMSSCGGDGGPQAASPAASPSAVASPPVAAVPPSAPIKPTASPAPTTAATTPPPTTPGTATATKPVSVDVVAGLIPPTDPDNWTRTVSKGRSDPFATLTLQPIEIAEVVDPLKPKVTIDKSASKLAKASPNKSEAKANQPLPAIKIGAKVAKNTAPIATIKPAQIEKNIVPIKPAKVATINRNIDISHIPRSGIDRKLPKIAVALKPKSQSNSQKINLRPIVAIKPVAMPSTQKSTTPPKSNITLKPIPQPLKTTPSEKTVVPTTAEPKLAKTVGISGLIQIEGKTQVIVRLPNESFSRYVEVGDQIYDGQIKIKRVEGEQTLSPIVVLEEVGIEVTRKVGDLPGASNSEAQSK